MSKSENNKRRSKSPDKEDINESTKYFCVGAAKAEDGVRWNARHKHSDERDDEVGKVTQQVVSVGHDGQWWRKTAGQLDSKQEGEKASISEDMQLVWFPIAHQNVAKQWILLSCQWLAVGFSQKVGQKEIDKIK